jgi:hypothetical protein
MNEAALPVRAEISSGGNNQRIHSAAISRQVPKYPGGVLAIYAISRQILLLIPERRVVTQLRAKTDNKPAQV